MNTRQQELLDALAAAKARHREASVALDAADAKAKDAARELQAALDAEDVAESEFIKARAALEAAL